MIEVLKSDDFVMLDIGIVYVQSIYEVDAGRIRGIAVGHKDDFLIGKCCPDSFLHGNDGRLSTAVVSDMIGGDFQALGRDEEENVVMLAENLDVGFIAR